MRNGQILVEGVLALLDSFVGFFDIAGFKGRSSVDESIPALSFSYMMTPSDQMST